MLTLDPNSVCDVCAEEYGPLSLPRCIPCGHVLCETCSTTICSKTSPRLSPACPFCREPFTNDDIRVIRADCSSAANTPRNPILSLEAPEETILYRRDDDRLLSSDTDVSRSIIEARRLEDRVAKVANKKCSVEEVHNLHKDLQDWLMSDGHTKSDQHHASLQLSAALIRAILMNHIAHSEAMKVAKGVENNLRERLEDGELIRQKLEGENKKLKAQLSQKTQDYHHVKSELNRLKIPSATASLGLASTPPSIANPTTPTRSRRQSVSTVQMPDNASTISIPTSPTPSPHSNHHHARTISLHAPGLRSGAASMRSMTPGPGHSRSMTPAPPPLPRAMTPAIPFTRPPVPPKPRTLTGNSPPNQPRGIVDDRDHKEEKKEKPKQRHERWIPSPEPPSSGGGRLGFTSLFGATRSKSS